MDQKFTVTLTGPAKLGGVYRQAGESVSVTARELIHLVDGGAISREAADAVLQGAAPEIVGDAFDRAVAAKAQQLAELVTDAAIDAAVTGKVSDIEKQVSDRFAAQIADQENLIEKLTADLAEEAKAKVAAQARIAELEEQLAAATAERATNTPKAASKAAAAKS